VGGDQQGEFFRQFNETIKKLGLEQHVIITGETTAPGVYYPLMNVFCMTSREEPFGLVMLEAGSCGVPVVCFEKSGFPPEFTTPDVGFAIPHENIIAMAAKIVLLKNNPELHMEFSKNILKKVSTYTFDSMAEKVYAVIQQTQKKTSGF
jgi:glycosyltransferase involved in cell wall biosynthesis